MSNRNKNTIKKETKKEIYARYGIQFDGKKIFAPVFGWIRPLLKKGNTKIGMVWAFSMLPREIHYTFTFNHKDYNICGTCWGTCRDPETGEITCYACAGHYQRQSVRASLGINTWLARYCLDFLERAIKAQIEADRIQVCRVHVAGDFFGTEYIEMWRRVAESFPAVSANRPPGEAGPRRTRNPESPFCGFLRKFYAFGFLLKSRERIP